MKLINGILVLLLCQCCGEAIKAYFDLSLPGPVLGMLFLFAGLTVMGKVPKPIEHSSQQLISLLGLMFLPAAAGIFFLGAQFADQWLAIIAAIAIGTFLSLLFNVLIMRSLANRRKNRHRDATNA